MDRMRDKSLALEKAILETLSSIKEDCPSAGITVSPSECELVCPEFRQDAVLLDSGQGWHHLTAADQRTCRISFAVLELLDYLEQITGQRLPVQPQRSGSRLAIELKAGDDAASDGFSIKRNDEIGVILHGNNPRSLLYAVYYFLECQGCRWYGLGADAQIIPQNEKIILPETTDQCPSFPLRFFHSHLENRATAAMLDWFGKNRLNLWGADNDRPGQRSRGIDIYGGNHWLIHRAGFDKNFDISDEAQRRRFLELVVDLYSRGHYRDVDFVDYIGEDWGKRVDSPGMAELGSPTDQDVFLLTEIQKALDAAYEEGRINRRVHTWGWAYYDTMKPPTKPLPEGFAATVGLWAQFDPRFSLDDTASAHNHEWPSRVTQETVEYMRLPSNIDLWEMFRQWPCAVGIGDYHSMARNFFLPAPFVTLLTDTLPKLAYSGAVYYSIMHIAGGFWGLMEPAYYLMARLLWDSKADAVQILAEYFRDRFGQDAPSAVRCLFAVERAMLTTFWVRSYVAKQLLLVTLHDSKEPFWIWGEHFTREEMIQSLADLETARTAVGKMADTPSRQLWEDQIDCADAMQRLHFHAAEAYEAARMFGSWHFCRTAVQHFNCATAHLSRLAAVDLPVWTRNVHYYPRPLMEQTLIGPALERISAYLGIPLSEDKGLQASSYASDRSRILSREVWRHGDHRPLQVGLGNYRWAQPYVDSERVFITGQDSESSPPRSVLRCLNLKDGSVIWEQVCEDSSYSAVQNVYMGTERNADSRIRSLILRECHKNPGRSSAVVRVDAGSGEEIWRFEDPPEYPQSGNGAALVLDLDGDGRLEVVDSAVEYVAVLDLETGKLKWRYDDHIKVCHGVTAAYDIDGDGELELILGGEYNDADGKSSLVALRNDGRVLWRSGGHAHDLGSTRTFVLDVDGDGKPEILHASLELLGCGRLPHSDLYCWSADGTLRYRAPFGGREVSIADFNGDGRIEAISITSGRDGGYGMKPCIICLDAATGEERWRTHIPRHYLDDDHRVVADFDGDGLPEALLFTANQGGYGHIPGQPKWCDAYMVKGTGEIIWSAEFGDMSYATLIGDPSHPEGLIIASGGGIIQRLQ